jgi:lipopolysaccharide biosynthesis glycosyltransferase
MTYPIYVALAADDKYAQHMAAVALSLLHNAENPKQLHFFFLDAGIAAQNLEKLREAITQHGASCEFIQPDLAHYRHIPTRRFGVAALLRLSLGSLLPTEVEKVIYMDCDTLAFDDIGKLWETDLGDCVVGAVTNLGHQCLSEYGIAEGEYFNTGVLLINLRLWREEHIEEQALQLLTDHDEGLQFPDQDCLNRLLKDRWQHLSLRWNLQPATYSMHCKGEYTPGLTKRDYDEAITNPGIVHYIGKDKPWVYMSFHPLKENYWANLTDSPWSGATPQDRTITNRVRKAVMFEKQIKRLLRRRAIPISVRNKGF